MAFETGGRIFFQFPVRNTAVATNAMEPLVAQPAGRAAVAGVVDREGFITVGCDAGLISRYDHGLDAMEQSPSRGPQLDFSDQPKKLHPLSIITYR